MSTPAANVPIAREPAWRLLAREFQETTLEHQDGGERSPSYLVTPLGARVNRAYVVGVLTSNENVGENLDAWRAQVTDPTGVFHIWAGQYQPEASKTLSGLTPPAIVAVVGKVRAFRPEEGVVYTSIRPEVVMPVTAQERDAWILEAATQTVHRIEAMAEAAKMNPPSVEALVKLGYSERLATGVVQALQHYGPPELARYKAAVEDALGYLMPGPPEPALLTTAATGQTASTVAARGPGASAGTAAPGDGAAPPQEPALDVGAVLSTLVEQLDKGEGAAWEDIVDAAAAQGLGEEAVEEGLNALMDQGRVFEPVLGRLKPA